MKTLSGPSGEFKKVESRPELTDTRPDKKALADNFGGVVDEDIENAAQEEQADVMSKMPAFVVDAVNFVKEYKKLTITTAIFAVVTCTVLGICNFVASDIFKPVSDGIDKSYLDLQNEMENFKRTDKHYTGIDDKIVTDKNIENIKWIGDKIDTGRWQADESFFWDWIYPSFSYTNADEYNKMRQEYQIDKGLGDCLFTVKFLAPFDPKTDMSGDKNADGKLSAIEIQAANERCKCFTDKSKFLSYPIGVTEYGDYHYYAMVPMSSQKNPNKYTMIAFTYTVRHIVNTSTNSETLAIADFNYWAPDPRDKYFVMAG